MARSNFHQLWDAAVITDMPNSIVISVDFELFSDTLAFQKLDKEWKYGENGESGLVRLLDLFEKYGVRSTFFVVAKHAQSHNQLLQRIKNSGHEIASHTMAHITFRNRAYDEIEREIKQSKQVLEDAINDTVVGFRSPAFRIDKRIAGVIAQADYKYDSSVVPSRSIPGWYGFPQAPKHSFNIREIFPDIDSDLMEFPVAVNPIIRMPISGAWMRLFGVRYTMWGIKAIIRQGGVPILYVHPWEIVDIPRLKGIPWRVYYRTGEQTLNMIEHIIKNAHAEFVPIRDLLETCTLKEAGP